MKHVIIVVFGLLFFVSCGKTQKENTPQKKVKKTKVTVSKKEKTTKKKSAVVVDIFSDNRPSKVTSFSFIFVGV